ncbi:MAG: flagellar biosynthetic protein FliR [Deltaproteobacteria bacterium]|nr:flagellar biosynthetic protein FliR [Deltaproteobacteria bacterium]
MDILGLSQEQFKCLILILLRVSIILFMFPVFGGMMVPKPVKAGLALMITIVLFPIVRPDPRLFPESLVGSINLILSELVLGLISGQLIGFQMGFAIANVLDPESGTQGSILAQLGYWVALLCFLILDGHHVLLETLANSFSIIKMGSLGIGAGIFNRISEVSGDMFAMAIKIGAPAIAALLLTSAAFGIIARVVPQVNVLIVAFPIKIVVGLFFFGISLQILLHFTRQYVTGFEGMLTVIMRLMRV